MYSDLQKLEFTWFVYLYDGAIFGELLWYEIIFFFLSQLFFVIFMLQGLVTYTGKSKQLRTQISLQVVTHDSGKKLVSFHSLLHYVAQNKANDF